MNENQAISIAVKRLRSALATMQGSYIQEYNRIQNCRESVLRRYSPIFSPENVGRITAEQFKSFLRY